MPSVSLTYIYTLVALIAISSLLVLSFMVYAEGLRASSETRQLKNLIDSVAYEATELLTITITMNATSERFLEGPTTIGDKQYWLRLRNSSDETWLEGGFGDAPIEGSAFIVHLPNEASATGSYRAGYGAIHLECYLSNDVPQILLTDSYGGD